MAGNLDPQALQQLTVLRRKEVQRQRLGDYKEAVITLKSKVRDAEGQAMRETVQDKVCTLYACFTLLRCDPSQFIVGRCRGKQEVLLFVLTCSGMKKLNQGKLVNVAQIVPMLRELGCGACVSLQSRLRASRSNTYTPCWHVRCTGVLLDTSHCFPEAEGCGATL